MTKRWVPYNQWPPNLDKSLMGIRVPRKSKGLTAYGDSFNPLFLRSGSVGSICWELTDKPDFVKCETKLNWKGALVVRFFKGDNTELMWKDLAHKPNFNEESSVDVAIPRPLLLRCEIETDDTVK